MPRPTVLISDNEVGFTTALRRLFERAGVDVLTDHSSNVVELAASRPVDAILVDLLQSRDGLCLLGELKAHPATRSIPTVLMSGVIEEDAHQDAIHVGARSLGALAVVPKPLPEGFLEKLVHMIRPAAFDFDLDIDVVL